jgi:hypothetical protein
MKRADHCYPGFRSTASEQFGPFLILSARFGISLHGVGGYVSESYASVQKSEVSRVRVAHLCIDTTLGT